MACLTCCRVPLRRTAICSSLTPHTRTCSTCRIVVWPKPDRCPLLSRSERSRARYHRAMHAPQSNAHVPSPAQALTALCRDAPDSEKNILVTSTLAVDGKCAYCLRVDDNTGSLDYAELHAGRACVVGERGSFAAPTSPRINRPPRFPSVPSGCNPAAAAIVRRVAAPFQQA